MEVNPESIIMYSVFQHLNTVYVYETTCLCTLKIHYKGHLFHIIILICLKMLSSLGYLKVALLTAIYLRFEQ